MKKSNLIFTLLISAFYLIPILVFIAFTIIGNKSYTGISNKFNTVVIDNPELKPEDIIITTGETSDFPYTELSSVNQRSFLYYQGDRQYLPKISLENDNTIRVGGITDDSGKNEKLTFHIHLKELKAVYLNGTSIWPE